ncbi:MAG: primosomal protein N' [Rhodospirillales bacterium]|nr:primosomal protein N' [Rhodospirillales bacterium]
MDSPQSSAEGPNTQHIAARQVAVLLPLPLPPYDYRVPDGLALTPGDLVEVPFGRRSAIGVVWGDAAGGIAEARLRDVSGRVQAPPLPEVSLRFVRWVADYTLHSAGAVLKMVVSVPDALKAPKPTVAYTQGTLPSDFRVTPARARVLAIAAEGPPRAAIELAREAAAGPSVVRGLVTMGALLPVTLAVEPAPPLPDADTPGPTLSPEQAAAAQALEARVQAGGFSVTVLDGVPGAGKTEIYFQAIARALGAGRQALVLLPEIALSVQWLQRFRERFGAPPTVWHSNLTQAERRANWRAVALGRARVVVGARSALFLPFPDLGLLVVDEEHDAAFKQEEGVVYNARDMAVVRAQLGRIPIALVSATPSLETVINVRAGRYQALHLPDRHLRARMPEISIVDMRQDRLPAGRWLAPALARTLKETLAAGQQAMLFLNRRGYAPLTLCRACGHRLRCPQCTAWLVEHRRQARLQCHHCGYAAGLPELCPGCGVAGRFAACGPGVERLAEEAVALLPGVRHVIAASDTVETPRAAEELVRRIEDHEIDLVIGTQIVAKGYHFPLLTLVGVVDADLGLSGGDLRAAERTYQLLYQVAGRAGRADQPGRVLLQTYMPEHPVMKALASGDRERFLDAEADARRQAGMPPFGRLVALIVSGTHEAEVDNAARVLARAAPRTSGIEVFGPAPAPLALLRGRHRRRLLMKTPKDVAPQPLIRQWLGAARVSERIRVQIDVDPYSFL